MTTQRPNLEKKKAALRKTRTCILQGGIICGKGGIGKSGKARRNEVSTQGRFEKRLRKSHSVLIKRKNLNPRTVIG